MADVADCERGLAAAVRLAFYPNGLTSPSVVGFPVEVSRGWPTAAALDADLKAGRTCVTVSPRPGMSRLTTRSRPTWRECGPTPPGITVSVSGDNATFAGTTTDDVLVGVAVGNIGYSAKLASGATAADAASALAGLVPGSVLSGATLTVPGALRFQARTTGFATVTREVRRQVQQFAVIVWCPTYQARDTCSAVADAALTIPFLPLSGNSSARLQYAGTVSTDAASKDALWRRDLHYALEYPTTETRIVPRMLWAGAGLTPFGGPHIDLLA